eukprot:GEMP01038603.1.p1 GENE.GEMP01038603.1~~GEMP01038603.1.p1  ORF type:complete len:334 (+),score=62.52 GEMP01038603.1:78-1079(+)
MDGLYFTEDGCEIAEIRSGLVFWPNRSTTELVQTGAQSISLTIGVEKFEGIVSEGEILWSDGTKWIASALHMLNDTLSLGSANSTFVRNSFAAIRHTRFDLNQPTVSLFPSPAASFVGSQGGSPSSQNRKYLLPSQVWGTRISNMALRGTTLNPWNQEVASLTSRTLLSGARSPTSLATPTALGIRSSTAPQRHTAAWKSSPETPCVSEASPTSASPFSVTSGARIQAPFGLIRGSHAAQRGTRVPFTGPSLLFPTMSPTNRANLDPRLCSPASSMTVTGFQSPTNVIGGVAYRESLAATRGTQWFLPATGFVSPSARGEIASIPSSNMSPTA